MWEVFSAPSTWVRSFGVLAHFLHIATVDSNVKILRKFCENFVKIWQKVSRSTFLAILSRLVVVCGALFWYILTLTFLKKFFENLKFLFFFEILKIHSFFFLRFFLLGSIRPWICRNYVSSPFLGRENHLKPIQINWRMFRLLKIEGRQVEASKHFWRVF